MKQVVIYRRVSTSEQGKSGLGLEAQLEYIRRFCEYNNLEIAADYQDIVSGKFDSEVDRPGMSEAFKHARKLKCPVVVSKLDRLSRRAAFIFNLLESKDRFISAERGIDVDPMMLHMDAVWAEKERKTIGDRTKQALAAKKAREEPLGCHAHKNPEAAREKAIEMARFAMKLKADQFALRIKPVIIRMRADNMTVHQIADELNEQGNKTARGGQWHGSTVNNILKRLEIA